MICPTPADLSVASMMINDAGLDPMFQELARPELGHEGHVTRVENWAVDVWKIRKAYELLKLAGDIQS